MRINKPSNQSKHQKYNQNLLPSISSIPSFPFPSPPLMNGKKKKKNNSLKKNENYHQKQLISQ